MLLLGERRRRAFCTLLRVRTGTPHTRHEAGRHSRKPAGSIGPRRPLHRAPYRHLRLAGAMSGVVKGAQLCVRPQLATGAGPPAGLEGSATAVDGASARGKPA